MKLKLLQLLFLCSLGVYFAACFSVALDKEQPKWAIEYRWPVWFGSWKMFTFLDKSNTEIVAKIEVDGQWLDIDLTEYFPYKWESGPRYQRTSFRRSSTRMKTLASALCGRMESTPDRVRFYKVRWEKELGKQQEIPEDGRLRRLITWDCAGQGPKLKGRLL